MRIAIDYDETITEYRPFPIIAPIRVEARKYIKKLYDDGHILYLWTARQEPYLSECIATLKKEGLYQYFTIPQKKSPTGKIDADFYIDDRALIGELDWDKIYQFIERKKNETGKQTKN